MTSELGLYTRAHHAQLRAGRVLGDQAARAATGLVVVLDVDAMSAVNARHGDAVGDRLLRAVEANLREALSDVGQVVRLGGDQFLVVLPGQPSAAAVLAVITDAFRRSRVRTRTARSVRVTASTGWARWSGTDAAGVVPTAGARLVEAKAARHAQAGSPSERGGWARPQAAGDAPSISGRGRRPRAGRRVEAPG